MSPQLGGLLLISWSLLYFARERGITTSIASWMRRRAERRERFQGWDH